PEINRIVDRALRIALARVEVVHLQEEGVEQLVVDRYRELVPVGTTDRWVEDGDRETVRAAQGAELTADVLQAVPHGVTRLEVQIAIEIVPVVDLIDVRIRVRGRAGVDLIEILAPRGLERRLAVAEQVIRARHARRPVVPERIAVHRREGLLDGVVLDHATDIHPQKSFPAVHGDPLWYN